MEKPDSPKVCMSTEYKDNLITKRIISFGSTGNRAKIYSYYGLLGYCAESVQTS